MRRDDGAGRDGDLRRSLTGCARQSRRRRTAINPRAPTAKTRSPSVPPEPDRLVAHPPDDPPPALLALLALLALVATVESPRCTMLVAEVEAAPVPLLNPLQ